ncbi:MAG: alpha/beta fold hydrolase [Lacisediminihabitans sp.]
MTDQTFALSSGRLLGVTTLGDPFSSRIVVLCHPMPGASGFDPNPLITRRANVRVITFDRPGYGSSEPLGEDDSRQVQARADDIAEYLRSERTKIEQVHGTEFGVVGWGFGGAVALSLAARHPSLIDRVAVVGLAVHVLRSAQDKPLPAVVDRPPEPPTFDWDALGVVSDDTVLELPGLALRLDHMLAQAATQGTVGVETDSAAIRDLSWTDELESIDASTVLIYGDEDRVTGKASGPWLRRRISHARVVRVPKAGGLAIVNVWRRILEHVAPQEEAK